MSRKLLAHKAGGRKMVQPANQVVLGRLPSQSDIRRGKDRRLLLDKAPCAPHPGREQYNDCQRAADPSQMQQRTGKHRQADDQGRREEPCGRGSKDPADAGHQYEARRRIAQPSPARLEMGQARENRQREHQTDSQDSRHAYF